MSKAQDASNIAVESKKNKMAKGSKTICIPCSSEKYQEVISSPKALRSYLDNLLGEYPELFPDEMSSGYLLKDLRTSKKLDLTIHRIKMTATNQAYSIRPSFAMPYMTGLAKDVENALLLRKFSVPFWALAYVFGRDAMYWYRTELALGRNSLVGTTVKSPEKLPKDILADEKHSWNKGDKVYVATTVGNECILGASVSKTAGTDDLTKAYGTFRDETKDVNTTYKPETVNTDGWKSTQKAWLALFPKITIIICFLHAFIKIRDRAKKKFADLFDEIGTKVWEAYEASDKKTFSQRIRRLKEWTLKHVAPEVIKEKLLDLCSKRDEFSKAYDHPGSHRTSNMLDRLMKMMDRHLFNMQYFHGTLPSAELSVRANALLYNFCPSCPSTIKKYGGKISPAERLNGARYHDSWLQNLLISASLGGYHSAPQNPV